jgi:Flp pilus assembly protein TadG
MAKRTTSKCVKRRAASVVELAVCLPVIFLLMMGSLEVCGTVFLREGLNIAAYEGAVVAARKNSTTASVTARVNAILTARNVQNFTVSVSPAPESTAAGTQVTVTVSANASSNSLVPVPRFNTSTITVTMSAVKENL